MEGLVPFRFDFLAVTWCTGLGSSFGTAEQQLPIEEKWNGDNVTFHPLYIFTIRHTACSHASISYGRSTSAARRPDGNRVYDCRQGHNNPQLVGVGRKTLTLAHNCDAAIGLFKGPTLKFCKPHWLTAPLINSFNPSCKANFPFSCGAWTALCPGLPCVYKEGWNSHGSKSLFSTKALEIVLRGYQASKHIQKLPLCTLSTCHGNASFLGDNLGSFFFFF